MEAIAAIWPITGIVLHIIECNRMKTWCGTPIWEEPLTYVMFFPAMVAGPLMFLVIRISR